MVLEAVTPNGTTTHTKLNIPTMTMAIGAIGSRVKVVLRMQEGEDMVFDLTQWARVFNLNLEYTQTIGAGLIQIFEALTMMLVGRGKITTTINLVVQESPIISLMFYFPFLKLYI